MSTEQETIEAIEQELADVRQFASTVARFTKSVEAILAAHLTEIEALSLRTERLERLLKPKVIGE